MTLSEAITKLKLIIQEEEISFNVVSDTLIDCIDEALSRYNEDNPVLAHEAVAGNGTGIINMPITFTADFSVLKSVEYPIGSAQPNYLESTEYGTYTSVSGQAELRIFNSSPATGDSVNLVYTKAIAATSDIRVNDERGFLQLAAYFACQREISKEYNTMSSGEGLDFVNSVTSGQARSTLCDRFLQNYMDMIFGSSEVASAKGSSPGSKNTQWSTSSRFGGGRVFHEDDNG